MSELALDHLVSLCVLMEESHLRGKGSYCYFMDFNKAFVMVPSEHLWRKMEELEVPNEYICLQFPESMTRLYIMCVRAMIFEIFPIALLELSKKPSLTNSIWSMHWWIKTNDCHWEEGIEEVVIKNVVIMLLLYEDDVVLFANTSWDAQKLMRALEEFCTHMKSKCQ